MPMETAFSQATLAAERRAYRLEVLEARCRQAETPNSLRVFGKSLGINQAFRGINASAKAATLALELSEKGPADWHIQTGKGWTVLTARDFQRMSPADMEELVGH